MIYSNTGERMRSRRQPGKKRLKFLENLKQESRQAATAAAKKIVLARLTRHTRRLVNPVNSG